jgi:hypothetical protein
MCRINPPVRARGDAISGTVNLYYRSTMTNIISFQDFQDNEIRVTPDGRYSVYDVIRFCGKKNPHDAWKVLCQQFSEVIGKTENFKFPGRGQKETPVASRENILYIIGLLPGAFGRSYREETAKVFIQYLDASPELAESVIDRSTPEDLARIQRRLEGKKIRVVFTHELQSRGITEGWQFGACTNAIYKPILGGTAAEIREQRNLPAKTNLRDYFSSLESSATAFAEDLATRDMKRVDAKGFRQCRGIASSAAEKVRKAMD